jgi:hypothetical protein
VRFLLIQSAVFSLLSATATANDLSPFRDVVPAALNISYAHEMGYSADVVLANRKVTYRLFDGSAQVKTITVEPTLNQWSTFVHDLNSARVFAWNGHYAAPELARDGGYFWSFEIQLDNRHFGTDGRCCFPPNDDLLPSKDVWGSIPFSSMAAAVSRLVGHEFPFGDADVH